MLEILTTVDTLRPQKDSKDSQAANAETDPCLPDTGLESIPDPAPHRLQWPTLAFGGHDLLIQACCR